MKNLDKFRGCLVGGAVGDALGYAVEFLDEDEIFARYGENGITAYDFRSGIAEISDDTQMTLFTATGILLGKTRGITRGIMGSYREYIRANYRDWYRTQTERYPLPEESHSSWLVNQPELFARRAPGNTCLSALSGTEVGTLEKPINQSKGCGGVMRVAPIGLYFDEETILIDEIDRIGAEAAALTHGHSLGYMPAAGLVHLVQRLSHEDSITMLEAVEDMKGALARQFASDAHLSELLSLVDRAIALARKSCVDDLVAIHSLGEGWVAEETLAIAIYCSLKHCDDFEKAIVAAVNHGGDSDSTGAVAGNIVGAYLGYERIPRKFMEHLELKRVILEIADDLFNDCPLTEFDLRDSLWEKKYIHSSYAVKADELRWE